MASDLHRVHLTHGASVHLAAQRKAASSFGKRPAGSRCTAAPRAVAASELGPEMASILDAGVGGFDGTARRNRNPPKPLRHRDARSPTSEAPCLLPKLIAVLGDSLVGRATAV